MASLQLSSVLDIRDKMLHTVLHQYKNNSAQFFGLKHLSPETVERISEQINTKFAEIIFRFQDAIDSKVLVGLINSMREVVYCVIKGLTSDLRPAIFANRLRANHCETAGLTFKCPQCTNALCHSNWVSADLFCPTCMCEGEVKSFNGVLGPNRIKLGIRAGVEAAIKKGSFFLVFSKGCSPQFFDKGMWSFNEGPQNALYLDMIKGVSVDVSLPAFDPLFFSSCLKEIFDFTMAIDNLPSCSDFQYPPNFTRTEISLSDFERATRSSLSDFENFGRIRKLPLRDLQSASSEQQWRKPRESQSATSEQQWRKPRESQSASSEQQSRKPRESQSASSEQQSRKPRGS